MGGRGGGRLPPLVEDPLLVEVVEAGLATGGGTTAAAPAGGNPAGVWVEWIDFVIDLGVVLRFFAKVGVAAPL